VESYLVMKAKKEAEKRDDVNILDFLQPQWEPWDGLRKRDITNELIYCKHKHICTGNKNKNSVKSEKP